MEEKPPSPEKAYLFQPGSAKPEGSGRQKGTPNKKTGLSIDAIRESVAKELGKQPEEIMATRILYLVANRADALLGLDPKTITLELSLDAASKLANFEVPKKRAIEVTGLELAGGAFVLSTGAKPANPDQSSEEWAAGAKKEAEGLELERKAARLAELEAEKQAAQEEREREDPQ